MTILASLEKAVKAGTSTWEFCQNSDKYFARNSFGKTIECSDLDDLRRFYQKMKGYGFSAPLAA